MINLLPVISHMVELLFRYYKEARCCARNDGMCHFHRNKPTEIHCERKRKYIPESGLPHRLRHLHSFPRLLRYRLLLTAERERARPSYVRIWGEREISMPTTNMFKGENISMARCSLHTYRYLCTRGNADAKSKREEKTELESRQRQLARWWQCL